MWIKTLIACVIGLALGLWATAASLRGGRGFDTAAIGPWTVSEKAGAPDADPAVKDRLQVVFGTGQVGRALAAYLARQGRAVRAVSRRQPPALDQGVEWRPADVTDPQAARDAAKGA